MASQFGNRIKELRKQQHLLQRQVAAQLDLDTPLFSKIERGERTAKKEIVLMLAQILNVDKDDLVILWLADQLYEVLKDEPLAEKALIQVSTKIIKAK